MANIIHNGGEVYVDYKLMPLTAEETIAGGECFGMRYAMEHKDRWIDVTNQIFNLQTYDRGFTRVRANGRTYQIYQDFNDTDLQVRLFIGKDSGAAADDQIGGLQTMGMTPKNLFTWNELMDLGVVNDAANLVITWSKLLDENGSCLIGNTCDGGVHLIVPPTTTGGDAIIDVSTDDAEAKWSAMNYPTKYICKVTLPEGLTSIGLAGPAFPMLGKQVIRHGIEVTVPKTVTTIGKKAFYGAKLQTLSGSKLREFTVDDALTLIDESAFEKCGELTTVHFGPKLKTVNSKAFSGCRKAQIHFKNTIESVAADACTLVGDVEYTPRLIAGNPIPEVVANAPFNAKLWNGKTGYTPGFYTKPKLPENPDLTIPGCTCGGADREPLDLSGVIAQVQGISAQIDAIVTP